MRRFILLLAIALIVVVTASADPLCTGIAPSVNIVSGGFSCEALGVVFSDFSATWNQTGTPVVNLMNTTIVGSTVYLTFNPNMGSIQSPPGDMYFNFTVTGGLLGLDLTNMGSGGVSIQEVACAVPFGPGNFCSQEDQLGQMVAGSGQHLSLELDGASPIYIWKDIQVPEGGHLSSFTQSFETPEPVTFGLIGSGLLLLGLLRRRAR